MSWLEARLQAVWYGGRKPGLVLRALSVLYGAVVRMRRAAYRIGVFRTHRVGAPVVVVGNINVGGSGKTPLVIALVEHLKTRGWSPGVVSRGYGRVSRGQRDVRPETSPEEGGDEPVLIARRCAVPVVVDADRVAAARRIIALGANIVVADDGLQHYRLHRDLEIEVIDGRRRNRLARLLPAGPLREPAIRAAACELHVVNGGDVRSGEWPMKIVGGLLFNMMQDEQPYAAWRGKRVHAVAGIGHPGRFFDFLRENGMDPVEHPFPDHHAFAPADLQFAEDLPIVMTEKDWAKCVMFKDTVWMARVHAELPQGFFDELQSKLESKRGRAS